MKYVVRKVAVCFAAVIISGYSLIAIAENKPSLQTSSIEEVMKQLNNITASVNCQQFNINTQATDSREVYGHHQGVITLDQPWSSRFSQMFVANSAKSKGSIYSVLADENSINDNSGRINANSSLSPTDKLVFDTEPHPSDMAWIRAGANGRTVDKGLLIVAKNHNKSLQFYQFSALDGQMKVAFSFDVSKLKNLDVVMSFEREIENVQWIYVVGWNGRARPGGVEGIVHRIKRDSLFDDNGDVTSSDWTVGNAWTEDVTDHWRHGQHATVAYIADEWWVISMEAESKSNVGDYGFHASQLSFSSNDNDITFSSEKYTAIAEAAAPDCENCYHWPGADGASNIEAQHSSGQILVTLGALDSHLLENGNYQTRIEQCYTN